MTPTDQSSDRTIPKSPLKGFQPAADRRFVRIVAYRLAGLAFVFVALAVPSACSSNSAGAPADSKRVRVTEHDFRISVQPARIPPGDVRLVIHNKGPDTHELLVVRAPNPNARLPLRADGFTVDEEALQKVMVGSLDGGAPGSVRQLALHLAPGRYELFCNMAGHYMGGMQAELVVT